MDSDDEVDTRDSYSSDKMFVDKGPEAEVLNTSGAMFDDNSTLTDKLPTPGPHSASKDTTLQSGVPMDISERPESVQEKSVVKLTNGNPKAVSKERKSPSPQSIVDPAETAEVLAIVENLKERFQKFRGFTGSMDILLEQFSRASRKPLGEKFVKLLQQMDRELVDIDDSISSVGKIRDKMRLEKPGIFQIAIPAKVSAPALASAEKAVQTVAKEKSVELEIPRLSDGLNDVSRGNTSATRKKSSNASSVADDRSTELPTTEPVTNGAAADGDMFASPKRRPTYSGRASAVKKTARDSEEKLKSEVSGESSSTISSKGRSKTLRLSRPGNRSTLSREKRSDSREIEDKTTSPIRIPRSAKKINERPGTSKIDHVEEPDLDDAEGEDVGSKKRSAKETLKDIQEMDSEEFAPSTKATRKSAATRKSDVKNAKEKPQRLSKLAKPSIAEIPTVKSRMSSGKKTTKKSLVSKVSGKSKKDADSEISDDDDEQGAKPSTSDAKSVETVDNNYEFMEEDAESSKSAPRRKIPARNQKSSGAQDTAKLASSKTTKRNTTVATKKPEGNDESAAGTTKKRTTAGTAKKTEKDDEHTSGTSKHRTTTGTLRNAGEDDEETITVKKGTGKESDKKASKGRNVRVSLEVPIAKVPSGSLDQKNRQEKRKSENESASKPKKSPKVDGRPSASHSSETKVVCCSTNIGENIWKSFEKVASELGCKFYRDFNEEAQYYVVLLEEPSKLPKRTIKLLKAVLAGCWIVGSNWLTDSQEKEMLMEPAKYEAKGMVTNGKKGGPARARKSLADEEPKLFTGCTFFFKGEFKNAALRADYEELVRLGGGEIIKREPTKRNMKKSDMTLPHAPVNSKLASCRYFIVQEEMPASQNLLDNGGLYVMPSWILDSVETYGLIDIADDELEEEI